MSKKRIAIVVAAITAALLAPSCNVIALKQKSLESQLAGAKLQWHEVDRDGDHLGYWLGGSPDGRHRPVLLVHGFGASGVWQWSEQAAALASDRTVLLPDLPWFGASSSQRREFGIDTQVKAVIGLLDALELDEVDVVGISYGGLVAYELAALHPKRVGRLVMVDSPGREYTRADYDALLVRFSTDDLAKVLIPSDTGGVARLMQLAYDDPPWAPPLVQQQALDTLYVSHREEQAALLHALVESIDGAHARPGRVVAPALVVWGKNDPVFPVELGERLATRLGAKLEVVEHARHFVPAEHPERVTRHLKAFLQ